MKRVGSLSFIFIGFALFAMFFGAGNLIYPLSLGQAAVDHWPFAAVGFFLTAVVLPLAGVAAMALFGGDYFHFFSCLGTRAGFMAIGLLLTVWIPLGSGPRCAALAHASLIPYLDTALPLWLFSAIYCSITFWVVSRKNRMLDILGYFLTPLLLFSLVAIVTQGVDFARLPLQFSPTGQPFFLQGLKEGYNTMDLIASFFFSASIIEILRSSKQGESAAIATTVKSSLIAALLLALVYLGLVCLSSSHASTLREVPKAELLGHLSKVVLGQKLGMIASLAVFLACLSTSVALSAVFANFLATRVFGDESKYFRALLLTQAITFCMSITGLEGVAYITAPLLQLFYPLLLLLIVYNISLKWLNQRRAVLSVPLSNGQQR